MVWSNVAILWQQGREGAYPGCRATGDGRRERATGDGSRVPGDGSECRATGDGSRVPGDGCRESFGPGPRNLDPDPRPPEPGSRPPVLGTRSPAPAPAPCTWPPRAHPSYSLKASYEVLQSRLR
jgi:hypothetical protein